MVHRRTVVSDVQPLVLTSVCFPECVLDFGINLLIVPTIPGIETKDLSIYEIYWDSFYPKNYKGSMK